MPRKNLERELWRRRAGRLDSIYLRLQEGAATPDVLARDLGLETDDVRELLDDLHIDNIVDRCVDTYRLADHDWYLQ